ncbi:MAG: GHMP kinase [Oscillochloris sp.]|nr:GHMP kinase [Oscillochloris sp.]
MAEGQGRILAALHKYGVAYAPYPAQLPAAHSGGRAAARAYPMQGILKYHGLADWAQRIAYLPSISINNAAAHTITAVTFDPELASDQARINGVAATGRELERVAQVLDAVRTLAGVHSRATVVSRNVVRARIVGKGLGTSASGAAALATAAVAALFGPDLAGNHRFLSSLARLLAGSGCRSAAGGLALWLSYPGVAHKESFALRLDQAGQLEDAALITIPIDSRVGLKTEAAHHDAPNSTFFKSWMLSRADEIIECIAAAQRGDWRTIGQFAELDSMRLHGVTMSGSREQKLIGWEPENITIFRMCNDLRAAGVPVYASTDTGPTVVLISGRSYVPQILAAIEELNLGLEAVVSGIGGPAELVDFDAAIGEIA